MVHRLLFLIKIYQKVLLDPEAGKDGRQKEKRAEDEMVRQHDQLNGHKSEQTPGESKGQESLVCCGPWGRRVRHHLPAEQQQDLSHSPA